MHAFPHFWENWEWLSLQSLRVYNCLTCLGVECQLFSGCCTVDADGLGFTNKCLLIDIWEFSKCIINNIFMHANIWPSFRPAIQILQCSYKTLWTIRPFLAGLHPKLCNHCTYFCIIADKLNLSILCRVGAAWISELCLMRFCYASHCFVLSGFFLFSIISHLFDDLLMKLSNTLVATKNLQELYTENPLSTLVLKNC